MARKVIKNDGSRGQVVIPTEITLRFMELGGTVVVGTFGRTIDANFELASSFNRPHESLLVRFCELLKSGRYAIIRLGQQNIEYIPPARVILGHFVLNFSYERAFASFVEQFSQFPCARNIVDEEYIAKTTTIYIPVVPWKNNQGQSGILTNFGIDDHMVFWTYEDLAGSLNQPLRARLNNVMIERKMSFVLGTEFPVTIVFTQFYDTVFLHASHSARLFSAAVIPETFQSMLHRLIEICDKRDTIPVEGSGLSGRVCCYRGQPLPTSMILPLISDPETVRQVLDIPKAVAQQCDETEESKEPPAKRKPEEKRKEGK